MQTQLGMISIYYTYEKSPPPIVCGQVCIPRGICTSMNEENQDLPVRITPNIQMMMTKQICTFEGKIPFRMPTVNHRSISVSLLTLADHGSLMSIRDDIYMSVK